MPSTERLVGGVIVVGILACLGLIVWPAGPRAALAAIPAPQPPATTGGSAPAAETLDPLTESVVAAPDAPKAAPLKFSLSRPAAGALQPVSFVSDEKSDPIPIPEDLSRVLASRIHIVNMEPKLIADFDGDSALSDADTDEFQRLWETSDERADLNGDGIVDAADFAEFVDAFNGQTRHNFPSTIELRLKQADTEILTSGGGSGVIELNLGSQVEFTLDRVNIKFSEPGQ